MGKGRIISADGEGLYTIELIEDRARANTERSLAVARVAALDERLDELNTELTAAQAAVDDAAAAQDQAILDYQAALADDEIDTAAAKEAMIEAGEALLEAAGARDAVAANIRRIKTERLAAQRRIDLIDALPPLRQQQAWCADLTEDLAGEVGTAEVPGEATQVLVHPGHEGAAAYDVARDGALQPALSGTAASVFYSLAMLPGWQKWRPTYRIATITALSTSTDSCDIDIEPATSSQQDLNVNAESNYAGVPIEYMTCHANAFEVGDRVLVRFDGQDHEQPKVIGFESQPRGCGIDTVVAVPVTLYYNEDFPFAIGGECACGEATPSPGMVYSARAMSDYVWRMEFEDGVEVFDAAGKRAQALNAANYSEFPTADHTVSESHEIFSLYRTPPKYTYDFPTKEDGVCTYVQDDFSRLAVTDDSPEVGGGDPFFNGELGVADNGSLETITLDDDDFTVAYDPQINQQEWESLEHGVYTVSGSPPDCTALYLLSKDRQASPLLDILFSIDIDEPSALRRFPNLMINGQEKKALGVFHFVPGENVFTIDIESFTIGGQTRVFDLHRKAALYLLVGYGR